MIHIVYNVHSMNPMFFFLVLKACVCPLICSKYFKSTRSMLPYFNLVSDIKSVFGIAVAVVVVI
jgi:hypothetical protein